MGCPQEQADRDQAALLYERAIAAQPGAKVNAPLANRIAQLYAFYTDKEKDIRPIRSKASQWWARCANSTNPRQLLWAQAQMGLACMAVISGDRMAALERYKKILDIDVNQAELPDWELWPDGSSDRGRAVLEQEQTRLRESLERVQIHAAEKQFYVFSRISKSAALVALQNVAFRYKKTPVGDRAIQMMADIRKRSGTDPWALPDLATAIAPDEPAREVEPQAQQMRKLDAAKPFMPTPASTPDKNSPRWGLGLGAIFGAAILAVGIVRVRRRGQYLNERRA